VRENPFCAPITHTFLKKLEARPEEQKRGLTYRLPTEAEWEYSCRGGLPCYSIFHLGNSLSSRQANFNGLHPDGGADTGPDLARTCSVGSYPPNAFGLYDMHANVCHWCFDWFGLDFYAKSPVKDPSGPATGSSRVVRGGSWGSAAGSCTTANRNADEPGKRYTYLGFRAHAVPSEK
jgi:formylglycine-generating enzyme required for sulfatase activity